MVPDSPRGGGYPFGGARRDGSRRNPLARVELFVVANAGGFALFAGFTHRRRRLRAQRLGGEGGGAGEMKGSAIPAVAIMPSPLFLWRFKVSWPSSAQLMVH